MKNSTQFYVLCVVMYLLSITYQTGQDIYAYHIVEHGQHCNGLLDGFYVKCPNPQVHLLDNNITSDSFLVFLRLVIGYAVICVTIILICLELLIIFFSLLTAFLDNDYSKVERNITWLFKQF